jgi:hypothetical protein
VPRFLFARVSGWLDLTDFPAGHTVMVRTAICRPGGIIQLPSCREGQEAVTWTVSAMSGSKVRLMARQRRLDSPASGMFNFPPRARAVGDDLRKREQEENRT